MDRLLVWSSRHRGLALALAIGLAALAGTGATRLKFETSLASLFQDRDGEYERYRDFEANFGSGSRVFVVATGPDLFDPEAHAWLEKFDESLSARPEILSVESIFRLTRITRSGQWFHQQPLVSAVPLNAAAGADLREKLLSDPRVIGNLASPDGKTLCFLVEPRGDTGAPEKLIRFCEESAASAPPGIELFAAGAPLIFGETQAVLRKDRFKLIFSTLVLLSGTLLLLFRGWPGLLTPMLTSILAVVATLGFAGWMNYPMTIVLLPAFVLVAVISAAESVYLVAAYHEGLANGQTRENAVARLGPALGKPLLFSTLTSAAGFATVAVAANVGLRHLASVGAFGIFANLLLTSLAAPALLALLPTARRPDPPAWIRQVRARLVRLPIRSRRAAGWSFALALVGIGAGVFQLRLETSFLSYLPEDNALVENFVRFRSLLGGASHDSVVIETHRQGGVFEKDTLLVLKSLRNRLLTRADFVYGLPDLLEEVGQSAPVPVSPQDRAQWIPPETLRRFVDHDASRTRFVIRSHAPGTTEVLALDRFIKDLPLAGFPPDTEISLFSPGAMAARTSDRIVRELLESLALLAVVTSAILGFALRSVRLGLAALIPNLLPLLATYGWMGWLGIEMGLGVFAVGIIAFAVSVNDTVHLLVTCQRMQKSHPAMSEIARSGLRQVAVPVIVTSLTLAVGFLALLFSGLSNLRDTGMLLAISSLSAMAADLLITPLLFPKRS